MPASLQTLPSVAREYHRQQRRQIDETVREVSTRWRRMGPRFDASWSVVGSAVAALVANSQREMAQRASSYVPAVLEDTGQARSIPQFAEPALSQLVGWTGAGQEVGAALSVVTIRAKQAVEGGATGTAALVSSGKWLASSVSTILADTARSAEGLGMYTRPVGGYVRMVNGNACGRCVILAGRWYRKNQGFDRHPNCKCVHIPASENVGVSWQTNPDEYFWSLNEEQQIKLMGSRANAQAVRDGADMGQLVNAYRRKGSVRTAQGVGGRQVRFTTEGTTRRGAAYRRMRAAGMSDRDSDVLIKGERYRRTRVVRRMPETIYAEAATREQALHDLRIYGWIL